MVNDRALGNLNPDKAAGELAKTATSLDPLQVIPAMQFRFRFFVAHNPVEQSAQQGIIRMPFTVLAGEIQNPLIIRDTFRESTRSEAKGVNNLFFSHLQAITGI